MPHAQEFTVTTSRKMLKERILPKNRGGTPSGFSHHGAPKYISCRRSPPDRRMSARFNWAGGPLAEGLRCYRSQQFFEAHEHWESVWLTLQEPEKSFLQSLIQVSAAFHHLQNGNRRGAISLLGRALLRLDLCSPEFCSLRVAKLREQVRGWLHALQHDATELPSAFPEFGTIERSR